MREVFGSVDSNASSCLTSNPAVLGVAPHMGRESKRGDAVPVFLFVQCREKFTELHVLKQPPATMSAWH